MSGAIAGLAGPAGTRAGMGIDAGGGAGAGGALGLPVPRAGPGVCATCHGPARDGRPDCWCCRAVGAALGHPGRPCPVVVPMAVCRPGDPLHRVLRGYKDAPGPSVRRHFAGRLTDHVQRFMAAHGGCAAEACGGWDALATVPSSARGPGRVPAPHPIDAVVDAAPCFAGLPRLRLEREPGRTGRLGHLSPDQAAFRVLGAPRARRVLLLDDAWVTGARVRSAAAALGDAGHHVVAMVVAGRIVDTGATPALARWWSWAERHAPVGAPAPAPAPAPCCLSPDGAPCAR